VETKEILKVIGGAAVQKLQDKFLPISYPVAGIDAAKLGLGIVEIAAAVFGERQGGLVKDVTEVLGIAGGIQVVNEIAKFAIPTAAPTAVPTAVSVAKPSVSFY